MSNVFTPKLGKQLEESARKYHERKSHDHESAAKVAPQKKGSMDLEAQKKALAKAINEKTGQAQATTAQAQATAGQAQAQGTQANPARVPFAPIAGMSTRITPLEEAAKSIKDVIKFSADPDLLKPRPAPEAIPQETIEAHSDKQLQEIAGSFAGSTESSEIIDINGCLSALKEARGWDVADDLINRLEALKEADQVARDTHSRNKARANAELLRRKAEREKEARKRAYLKEHHLEIIEALLNGVDRAEILATLENPPREEAGPVFFGEADFRPSN